jgi:L-iditol 2-dehydrogenase
MKALVLDEHGTLDLIQRDQPQVTAGTTVVRVTGCGICGTDRHIAKGEYPSRRPVILGHEFGGIVQATSPGSPAKVGDLVSVDPNITCGTCTDCLAGRTAFCPQLTALGVDIDGGLSEYVVAPNSQIYLLAPHVPPLHAAFVEPLACCIRGLDLAGLNGKERVAVLGGGVIGQLVAQLARLAGAEVCMVTRNATRQAIALELGARSAMSLEQAERSLPPQDVVFECAGSSDTFLAAQRLARRGGTVVVLGLTAQEAVVPIRPFDLVVQELRIVGSFLNPMTHARACSLVSDGSVVLEPLISRVVHLAEVPALLASTPADGEVKVLVDPSS